MSRLNALLVCGLLALATAAGGYAVLSTASISHAATKPQPVPASALAKRAKALAAWSRSLDRALRARPPRLPQVPKYAPVPRVSAPQISAPPPPPAAPAPASVIATVREAPRPVVARKPVASPPTTTAVAAPPVAATAPTAAPPPQHGESDDGEGSDG